MKNSVSNAYAYRPFPSLSVQRNQVLPAPEVLSSAPFKNAAETVASHPLFIKAEASVLPYEAWRIYLGARLKLSEHFIPYLSTLVDVAAEERLGGLCTVVRENLAEEEGRKADGTIDPARCHHMHRQWAKEGFQRIFEAKGIKATPFDLQVASQPGGYAQALQLLQSSGDPYLMAGGFVGMERMIGREYDRVFPGLMKQFPELTPKESLYFASHRTQGHEQRHFEEALEALQDMCDTPRKTATVLRGLEIMEVGRWNTIVEIAWRIRTKLNASIEEMRYP